MLTTTANRTEWPVSLDEAKAQLRIDEDDTTENTLLNRYIMSATELIEAEMMVSLTTVSFLWSQDDWGGKNYISLPMSPIREIEEVEYLDRDGVAQTVDPADWDLVTTNSGGDIVFTSAYSFPTLKDVRNAVRVYFDAGYDVAGTSGTGVDPMLRIPELVRQAILLTLSHWYANREGTTDKSLLELPMGVKQIIERKRVYR